MLIKIKNKDENMPLVETGAFRGMWDEYERMGFVESPSPTKYRNYMHNGWICSVEEFGGKWTPLAFKKMGGNELTINNLPQFNTREEAGRALHKVIGPG